MFPMIAFDLIADVEADAALVAWDHFLGACRRPFGRQSFGLFLAGELVSVAVSASTVQTTCGGFPRGEVVELARLCSRPDHAELTQAVPAPVAGGRAGLLVAVVLAGARRGELPACGQAHRRRVPLRRLAARGSEPRQRSGSPRRQQAPAGPAPWREESHMGVRAAHNQRRCVMSNPFLLLALLSAQVIPAAPTPGPAPTTTTAAAAAPAPSPSIFGVTAWEGTSGSLEVGVAVPLAAWPSLFWHLGQGELVALLGKSEAGLAIGHRFRNVHLEMGKVSMGAAVGIGGVVPFSQVCQSMPGHTCRTGLRAARPVLFVTLPLEPR